MNNLRRRKNIGLGAILLVALLAALPWAGAQGKPAPAGGEAIAAEAGTEFTYQGSLARDGVPYNGACDIRFTLYDNDSGGQPVGDPLTSQNVGVGGGLFNVALDFGAVFDGRALWLQLEVACPPGSPFEPLGPRQPLSAAPYALYAQRGHWRGLAGVPAGFVDGVDDDTLAGLSCLRGQIARWAGTGWVCTADGSGGGNGASWSLTGNSGTTPGANFLGTTDDTPLELHVNGQRALRLAPTQGSPNLIGGHSANFVPAGVQGATIGGGGQAEEPNSASAIYSTVSGGEGNSASGPRSTVGGGVSNSASVTISTVGGGQLNSASGNVSTISGGSQNTASGPFATIGGGSGNSAGGQGSTIGGGVSNQTTKEAATIAGGNGNGAGGEFGAVGGGHFNHADGNFATVAGGDLNAANGSWSAICGGRNNTAAADDAVVCGGVANTASGVGAVVIGGSNNTASGAGSVALGRNASAIHDGAFVWSDGSGQGVASREPNSFTVVAAGGTAVYADSQASVGIALAPGSGAWSSASDRNLKENFNTVDTQAVLAAVADLPIQSWNYLSQPDLVRHLGPTAQDFQAAFGLGEDDRHISAVDADGIALAAIQGLYAENRALQQENDALSAQLSDLEARLGALENGEAGRNRFSGPVAVEPEGWPKLLLQTGAVLAVLAAAAIVVRPVGALLAAPGRRAAPGTEGSVRPRHAGLPLPDATEEEPS